MNWMKRYSDKRIHEKFMPKSGKEKNHNDELDRKGRRGLLIPQNNVMDEESETERAGAREKCSLRREAKSQKDCS